MIVAPSGMSATAASIERQTFSFKGIMAMFDFLSWMAPIRKENAVRRVAAVWLTSTINPYWLTRSSAKAKIEALTAIQTPDNDTIDPLGTLLQQAIENRRDLRLAHVQLENTNISLEGSRNEVLTELNLVASMQNNGLAGSANSNASSGTMPASSGLMGGYGTVEQQIFSRDYPSYSVGVQLSLPLRKSCGALRLDARRLAKTPD
jgi:hypothetical protein